MLIVVIVLAVLLSISAILMALMMHTLTNLRRVVRTMTAETTLLRDKITAMTGNARSREKKAVATSRIVHVAKISEQLAPLLPNFPDYNLKDVQWVGGTVDAIVWDGLEEDRDVTVVLLDVKTGNATISHRQRRIRDAVESGRVKFEVVRISSPPVE